MSYEMLSEPIRKYIREKHWTKLFPIQNIAISKILTTDSNYILSSKTASGKTEAAFLPILSKVDFNQPGVQVLYVLPLIALINDQFYRMEKLCDYLDITITKWHGEASKSAKAKLMKKPSGIVLITPESLESLFMNHFGKLRYMFSNLKYIVIDEIHSFIGVDRGVQLRSILSRLQKINSSRFFIIGLSATIGDSFEEYKQFTGDAQNTKILIDRTPSEIDIQFKYFLSESSSIPIQLVKNLYKNVVHHKVLVFPNSRGAVEEVSTKLSRISVQKNGHKNFFSHHSSIDKELREYVEHFAKTNDRQNFCIACTSTLELGIDIGSIDMIVQIDATANVSSLIQRIGRSGRKPNEKSRLLLYSTNQWSLLQALSCWTLYLDGFIEPITINPKPYNILLHQMLSMIKQYHGQKINVLIDELKNCIPFNQIESNEILEILMHLVQSGIVEQIKDELIIGIDGEILVNHYSFYCVFPSEDNYKVIHAGVVIGELPVSNFMFIESNVLLAAKIWKIISIDNQKKKLFVVEAKDGEKPLFEGTGMNVHFRVRERMLEILFQKEDHHNFLDRESQATLDSLKMDFSCFKMIDSSVERLLLSRFNTVEFYTFTGTKINHTISFLFSSLGTSNELWERSSMIEFTGTIEVFQESWNRLLSRLDFIMDNLDSYIQIFIEENPRLLDSIKFLNYLPTQYQIRLFQYHYFDFSGAIEYIKKVRFVLGFKEEIS